MKVKLLRSIKSNPCYQAPAEYNEGDVVRAKWATNLPYDKAVWIDEPEVSDCPVGIFLSTDEYEVIEY